MGEQTVSYIELVYGVLKAWYVRLAEITPNLIVGLLVFFFFFSTSKYLSKVAVRLFHKAFPKSKVESVTTLVGVFRFLIMIMGTFISLEIMGFSGFFVKFLGSLGVAGVIAGVALKDLVSSIFSGMLVGIDKAFVVGDYITIGNHSGTVQEIGFLTTKLITDEGKKVYVPNQVIFNAPFYNVTASPQRKVILNFEIPMEEDLDQVKEGIETVISNLDKAKEIHPEVLFTNLNGGLITVQAKFLVELGSSPNVLKSNAIVSIKNEMTKRGIRFSSPTSISLENHAPSTDATNS
ncbi:mechanosensitive ion channel domain-containing protein [Soonwooa sp.]|uniref:mechanosensitive ion channel family protein n=1 Tax=Soonwooa sp. TaxID=1938592 RepID=UPI0028A64CB9|nr:mechanosensitive ion channel domain-containing protein [Soonwooa sp.]